MSHTILHDHCTLNGAKNCSCVQAIVFLILWGFKKYVYAYVYLSVCEDECSFLQRSEEDIRFPGAGFTGGGEPPEVSTWS